MAIKSEHYFYASNGAVLKSKGELLEFLENVDDQVLQDHVNTQRNDFANWTKAILKDKKLAKKMQANSSKEMMCNAIKESIKTKQPKKRDKKSIISQLVNAITNG